LIEFFINPQIYFYNSIFGFYPGTIYDEDLSLDRVLITYRICNLIFFTTLILIAERNYFHKYFRKILVSIVLILISLAFVFFKPIFHFATDKARLDRSLNKSISTEHFIIHYPDSLNKREVIFAAILHEYYFDQLAVKLGIHGYKQKIDSYIFADKDQKRELLGSGNADIAKPWLNHIYLNFTNYEGTLKHELTHVLAGTFGNNILKVAENLNPSMIEGLAMAIEDNYNGNSVHYMAKLAFQSGYNVSIENLFQGLNFFTRNSSMSYIYSGSFIKFLIDEYGIKKVKLLYGNSDFASIFGKSISTLALEYSDFLKKYQIESNVSKAKLYYGGKTIFKKFCPRAAAADVKKAWLLFSTKKINEALLLFQKIYGYSGSYQSLNGIITCYSKEKKFVDAKNFLNEQLNQFKNSQYFYYLELVLGDLFIQTNRLSDAGAIYDSLLSQNPHIDYTNEVLIRKEILKEGSDSLKSFLYKNETLRYHKLLVLNENEIKYFSIPSLVRSALLTHQNVLELISKLKNKIQVTDYVSSYTAMKISINALKFFEYNEAQYYAVKSLNFKKDIDANHEFIENLRLINWFKNNANGIKETIHE
jgi:hypothetical protein